MCCYCCCYVRWKVGGASGVCQRGVADAEGEIAMVDGEAVGGWMSLAFAADGEEDDADAGVDSQLVGRDACCGGRVGRGRTGVRRRLHERAFVRSGGRRPLAARSWNRP